MPNKIDCGEHLKKKMWLALSWYSYTNGERLDVNQIVIQLVVYHKLGRSARKERKDTWP